jgi:ATP-binding cassette subfamily B protein
MKYKFPHFQQYDSMDCGAACLQIIAKYYGRNLPLKYLRDLCYVTHEGVNMFNLCKAAEKVGFRTLPLKVDFAGLKDKIPLPCIIHWEYNHFIVVYKITKKKVFVSDPIAGLISYSHVEFNKRWLFGKKQGNIIVIDTGITFNELNDVTSTKNLKYFFNYLKPYSTFLWQVFIGLLIGIILSLIFPFMSQAMMDIGIGNQDIDFVNLILISSLILTLSSVISGYVQSRIMLYVSDRMNINMISDFIAKLLRLPVPFFERKMVSDILLRIGDHGRIQNFVVTTLLGMTIAILSFFVYSGIMVFYSFRLFIIFIIGHVFFALWIFLFLKKRKKLDYAYFKTSSVNQNELLEILENIPDIKVNNLAKAKQWKWENSRLDIYNLNIKTLNLGQLQGVGSTIINNATSILISYFSAKSVIKGDMTLGMMMSAQYILGQLSGPLSQFLGYIQSYQDARISLDRVSEVVFDEKDEPVSNGITLPIPEQADIVLKHVTFHYNPNYDPVLKDISITLPAGKLTAIVGESGSGKTTLMKLLLRFYNDYFGEITIGKTDLKSTDEIGRAHV